MRGKRACNANARGRLIFATWLPIDLIEIKEIIVRIRAALNGRASVSSVQILFVIYANSHDRTSTRYTEDFLASIETRTHPLIVSHLAEFPETLGRKASLLDRGATPKRLCKAAPSDVRANDALFLGRKVPPVRLVCDREISSSLTASYATRIFRSSTVFHKKKIEAY